MTMIKLNNSSQGKVTCEGNPGFIETSNTMIKLNNSSQGKVTC